MRQRLLPVLAHNIANARRQIKHTSLRKRPLYEARHIVLRIANSLQTARQVQVVEEARDGVVEVAADVFIGDACNGRVGSGGVMEDGKGFAVAVG